MLFSELSKSAIIILVSGAIAIVALLFSRFLSFFKHRNCLDSKPQLYGYESGFEADLTRCFHYITEKNQFVAVYLVLEMAIVWLLTCCILDVLENDWTGKIFIRALLLIIFTSMFIIYRFLFRRKDNAQE